MEVTREIVFPVPPDEVWEALTDPAQLEEWF
ncbi:MAG: SRPBCC family protein, partial [Gaiellaceae bacterium]